MRVGLIQVDGKLPNLALQDGIDAGGMIIDEKVYCPDCARKIREGERI